MNDLQNTTQFIVGGTGTGKSYLASSLMKTVYDKKERVIYTNVNLRNGFDDYIKDFDKDDLYDFAEKELELYRKFQLLSKKYRDNLQENEDMFIFNEDESKKLEATDIIFDADDVSLYYGNYDEYMKASGILNKFGGSMIVWDECQEDLQLEGKPHFDAVWGRFFSYRRHFGIYLILITQDFDLIHRKYKKWGDKYYFGQNSSRRFISSILRFEIYFKSQEFKKYHLESKHILMKKEIQNFYDTGEKNVGKSAFSKFLFLPILLIFIIYFGYQYTFGASDLKSIDTNDTNISSIENKITNIDPVEFIEDEDKFSRADDDYFIFFNCNLNNCTIRDSSFTIPLKKMTIFAQAVNMEILYSSKINNNYSLVVVNVNGPLYKKLMNFSLILKGEKHENNKMDFASSVSF